MSEIVSPLHYCAYATGYRQNRNLLTEQALPLSEGSLSRQQVFGISCVLALADSTLCCCRNWILQITAVLFYHERGPTEGTGSCVSCVPYSCQVRTASAAQVCLYSTGVFTDQPPALQLLSAAVSPHTERCAGWLATPVRTGASILRFAHSTVASLNTSRHGSQLMTQATHVSHVETRMFGALP